MKKAPCVSAQTFIKHHLGKSALAPHTGQDFAALNAFAHLCELYAVADTKGRESCLKAMAATLACAQRSTWDTFAKCIPHSLDWSDEARIWALIVPRPTETVFCAFDRCDQQPTGVGARPDLCRGCAILEGLDPCAICKRDIPRGDLHTHTPEQLAAAQGFQVRR